MANVAKLGRPNNDFIGACIDFDQLLTELQALRAAHFGVDPDGQRTSAEVARAEAAVTCLRCAVAALLGKVT